MGDKKRGANQGGGAQQGLFEGSQEFVQLFKRGADFFEEILQENEKLRFENARFDEQLKSIKSGLENTSMVEQLESRVQQLQEERERLLMRYQEIEHENHSYQERYSEIEEEHNTLANLYIASYQLHSTMAFEEVCRIIIEIAINLIGIGRLVLYLLDENENRLYPIAGDFIGETFEVRDREVLALDEGRVGRAVAKRKQYVADPPNENEDVLAVLPLLAGERRVGALVLERFLVQKDGWSNVDFELFKLLGAHAGTALLAATLSGQVAEKISYDAHVRRLVEGQ